MLTHAIIETDPLRMKEHELGKSKEDYLEAILKLINKNGACRSTDIAQEMGFSRPSVSVAVRNLEQEGYLVHDDWRILLTEKGEEIARRTTSMHEFFADILRKAGIEKEVAEEEACGIEHIISEESFRKIRDFVNANFPQARDVRQD